MYIDLECLHCLVCYRTKPPEDKRHYSALFRLKERGGSLSPEKLAFANDIRLNVHATQNVRNPSIITK